MSQVTSSKDRVPPHNLEAEKATLGAILINPDGALDTVIIYLRPDDFYKNSHKIIFKAILELSEKGENIDILTVVQQLRNNGRLDDCGGASYISSLSSEVPSSANVEYYSKIVQENSIRRGLIKLSGEISLSAFDDTRETAYVLEEAEKLIFEIIEKRSTSKYQSLKELLPIAMKAIEILRTSEDSCTGIPSGFKDLDEITNGFQKSEFIVIGARPSIGKTALALSMAANIAIRHKIPVGFFSLEMSEQAIMQRLISSEARVGTRSFRVASEIQISKLHDAAGDIYEAPLYLTSVSDLKILDLRALARKMIRDHGVKIIFIDYLTLIQAENKTIPRHEQIAEISRSLKALARELDIPVVVLSQVKRETEMRKGPPILADLRESGSIEQDADLVIFLHKEKNKSEDESKSDNTGTTETEVIIAKQRNGPIGDLKMVFIPQYTRFESKSKEENKN